MDAVRLRPFEPVPRVGSQLDVNHTVYQRRRHGLYNGAILGAIPCADDNAAFWQVILADTALMDQAVESLLDFLGTGIEFVKK